MPITPRGSGAFFAILFIALTAASARAQGQEAGGKCVQEPQFYEENKYKVRSVRIDTPLTWLFGSVAGQVDKIVDNPAMPIHKDDPFRKHPYDAGHLFVSRNLPELKVGMGSRLATRITFPSLDNCDPDTNPPEKRKLDIVYRVYTVSASNYLSRSFELGRKDEIRRGVTDTGATQRLARYFIQPYGGYNGSRNGYGGAKLTVQVPSGPVQELTVEGAGSGSSSEARGTAGGEFDREKGFVRYAEWLAEYEYTNTPGDDFRLKRGTGRAQFMAATKPLGAGEFILRFGGAVEGGNRQFEEEGGLAAPDAPDTGHKALKAFAGGNLRFGRHAAKASYGVQFGNAGDGFKLDYIKHVFDSAASFRFAPWKNRHRSVTLDAQFTAGAIQTRGVLPAAERFFGGNVERDFISGGSWTFRSDPFIRGFSENSFGRTAAGGAGGDRFFSTNLTVGVTAWHYALVPEEINDDCAPRDNETAAAASGTETAPSEGANEPCVTLEDAAETAIGVAETTIEYTYLAEAEEFKPLAQNVKNMVKLLDDLRPVICPNVSDQHYREEHCKGATPNPAPAVQRVIDRLYLPPDVAKKDPAGSRGTFRDVETRVLAIQGGIDEQKPDISKIWALVVRRAPKPEPPEFFIKRMVNDLHDLSSLLPASQAAIVNSASGQFDKEGDDAKTAYRTLTKSSDDPKKPSVADKAKAQAAKDMVYPKRIINELLYETNIISLNPVAMFDAARVWRSGRPAGDVRYSAGGGLRVSFVSLDFTAGYAWNLRRRAGEGRGAFVFTMDVSNLFR